MKQEERPDGGRPRARLLLATRNPHKVDELIRLLARPDLRIESLDAQAGAPDVVEDGATFEANAMKKALSVARWAGVPALADDSGLEVDVLGGAPGVFSARYAGEGAGDAKNREKLLAALEEVADERRGARFRCVITIATPDGATRTAEGSCEGRIARVPAGRGGFGYDPLFVPAGETRTFAELSDSEKDARSHRGVAIRRAAEFLDEMIGTRLDGRAS